MPIIINPGSDMPVSPDENTPLEHAGAGCSTDIACFVFGAWDFLSPHGTGIQTPKQEGHVLQAL